METRPLGRTDMTVSAIGFGAWAIGGSWGPVDDAQSMVGVVETPAAVCGHCDDVLDTDAEPPREIDPRLY